MNDHVTSVANSVENLDREFAKANTLWFHMFQSMVHSEDFARMHPATFKVYVVIKSFVNLETGQGKPSIETIAKMANMSISSVKRAIKDLKLLNKIEIVKYGRSNSYRVLEAIHIVDKEGTPVGLASWRYVPAEVQSTAAKLNSALKSRDRHIADVVRIERLQVNINQVGAGGMVMNVQDTIEQIADAGVRATLSKMLINAGVIDGAEYTQSTDDTGHL